jgi:hypothetical protein
MIHGRVVYIAYPAGTCAVRRTSIWFRRTSHQLGDSRRRPTAHGRGNHSCPRCACCFVGAVCLRKDAHVSGAMPTRPRSPHSLIHGLMAGSAHSTAVARLTCSTAPALFKHNSMYVSYFLGSDETGDPARATCSTTSHAGHWWSRERTSQLIKRSKAYLPFVWPRLTGISSTNLAAVKETSYVHTSRTSLGIVES